MLNKPAHLFSLIIFFLFTISAVIAPSLALSRSYGLEQTRASADLPSSVAGQNTPEGLVGAIISSVLGLVGIIFFFIIFYSGFRWMTARGNSDIIDKSKEAILSATIGLVIVMAAYAITNFVFSNLASGGAATVAGSSCYENGGACAQTCTGTQLSSYNDCTDGYVCCAAP